MASYHHSDNKEYAFQYVILERECILLSELVTCICFVGHCRKYTSKTATDKWSKQHVFWITKPISVIFFFICSVTNKKPAQASITKVKQFEGSTSFVRRTQWMLEQLRQVNGIDPNRVSLNSSRKWKLSSYLTDWWARHSFSIQKASGKTRYRFKCRFSKKK